MEDQRWLRWYPVKILGSGSYGIAMLVKRKALDTDEDVTLDDIAKGVTVNRVIKIFWDVVEYDTFRAQSITTSAYEIELDLSRKINRAFLQNGMCPHFIKTTGYTSVPFLYAANGVDGSMFFDGYVGYSFQIDTGIAPPISCDIAFLSEDLDHIKMPTQTGIWASLTTLKKQIDISKNHYEILKTLIDPKSSLGVPCIGVLEMEYADLGEAYKLPRTMYGNYGYKNEFSSKFVERSMTQQDAKSLAFQMFSIWEFSKIMGFQHRDINIRNILAVTPGSRISCPLASQKYTYHMKNGRTFVPELTNFIITLADYSLSDFDTIHDRSGLTSPVVAAYCRPPELFFFSVYPVSYHLGSSDLFSMGLCLASTIVSAVDVPGPVSPIRLSQLESLPEFVLFNQALGEKYKEIERKRGTPKGFTFSSSMHRGKPDHFGNLYKKGSAGDVWNLMSLIGTSRDWGTLNNSPLWALMSQFIPDTDRYKRGDLFDPSSEYYGHLIKSLGKSGLKVLKAMLTPNPFSRQKKYEQACKEYFSDWEISDSSDNSLTSMRIMPLDRSNWGMQLGLRYCSDPSSGRHALSQIKIGSPMDQNSRSPCGSSQIETLEKICVICKKPARMFSKFAYSPVNHMCDVPDSVISFHVCSQKCSDIIFNRTRQDKHFLAKCAQTSSHPMLLAYYKNIHNFR